MSGPTGVDERIRDAAGAGRGATVGTPSPSATGTSDGTGRVRGRTEAADGRERAETPALDT